MEFRLLKLNLKQKLVDRRKWCILAILFFAAAIFYFLGPNGRMGDEIDHFLAGAGMRMEELTAEQPMISQEFVPQYECLEEIRIFVGNNGEMPEGCLAVRIEDAQRTCVFEQILLPEEIQFDQYMKIKTGLKLAKRKTYYLSLEQLEPGGVPMTVGICTLEQVLAENRSLFHGEELPGMQMLSWYHYVDAVTAGVFRETVLVCLLGSLVIAFGLPRNVRFRYGIGCLLLVMGPLVLGRRLELLTIDTQFLLPHAMKYNLAIMYLFEVVVLLVTYSPRVTVVLCNLVLTLLYSANSFMYAYRGVPLKKNDFTAIHTAAEVAGQYSFTPPADMAMAWCIAICFFIMGIALGKLKFGGLKPEKLESRKTLALRIASAVIAFGVTLGAGYVLLYTDWLAGRGFANFHGVDQNMTYHFDGYLVGTCMDIQNSRVRKPKGYSLDAVADILSAVSGAAAVGDIPDGAGNEADMPDIPDSVGAGTAVADENDRPHVIVVMNESLADLTVLGNLELNRDNLSFIHSLQENTVKGYVNASVLGGGTANSEFELLTGCSMGLLPAAYYAYQQCVVKPMNSLVSSMEQSGYTTWAMHPAPAYNWNRNRVYQYLDFDHTLWIEDFEGAQRIHSGVSDLETYRKIIDVYENREDGEKLFIFDLTMQNHGAYLAGELTEKVKALNVSSGEANLFLTLMQISDEAFEKLVSYFAKQEEKVVVCMFGDHQPKFSDEQFYDTVYGQTQGITETDKVMNKYKTPFLIWANYDIEEKEGLDISMNYLGVLLQQSAGLSMTPYFSFLARQMEEYPIITVNGYVDRDGRYSNWSGEEDEFLEYRILQYNYLFDNHTVDWGF